MTTAAAVPIPRHPDVDADLQRAAALRVADALRDAGQTGLVVRLLPTVYPRTWENNQTVQVVRGDRVVRAFTSEQVMNAHPRVLLYMIVGAR